MPTKTFEIRMKNGTVRYVPGHGWKSNNSGKTIFVEIFDENRTVTESIDVRDIATLPVACPLAEQ